MVELRWLKDYKDIKSGEIADASAKSAENFVSQGYAEYVEKPEKKEVFVKRVDMVEVEDKPTYEFSLFEGGIKNTIPTKDITLQEFLSIIKRDNPLLEQIRSEPDKDKRNKLKENLSYVTFGGVFSSRANNNLIKSSGFACLDIDGVENLEELRQKVISDKFSHCVFISPSGNGFKLLVKIPEVQNDSEYKQYWNAIAQYYNFEENDESTKDISRACYLSFDKEPFFNQNSEVFTQKAEARKTNSNIQTIELTEEDNKIISEIKGKWIEKDRQNLALSLSGYLRKEKKFGFARTWGIIQSICEEMGDKDLEERKGAVAETYKKDENKIKGIKGLIEREIKIEENSVKEFLYSKGVNKKTGEEEFSVDIDKVADYLINNHDFKTWFGIKSDYSFNWDGRIYNQDTRGIVKCECESLLKEYCKRNVVDEVFEKVKRKTKVDRKDFEADDTNFINLANGIWDIKEKKLIPHNSKYNFQRIIEIKKDENPLNVHNCPNWLNFLNETLYPEDVVIMQEWFGFLLFREYFIKKAMIGVGEQDTGKSVLMDTAIRFVGEENKTGLSLQKIGGGSDFTKLSLKNKLLNAYDDLSSQDVNDGGAFKVATGGGFISGEEKFGEFQQFRSYAKIFLMGNKIPQVKDNDDLAYFGRFIPIKFDNVPEKLDPFLRKKLWTDEEMSGILNWSLEGLYRLLENGRFSYNKTNQETKAIMEISGCPLVAFSSEVLVKEDGNVITKDEMYKVYSAWCEKVNRPRLSKEMLGRQLTKYCPYILAEKHKDRIWKNAKLSGDWVNLLEKPQKSLNNDTSDTSLKHICSDKKHTNNSNIGSNNMGDMLFEKVSEEPQKEEDKINPKSEYFRVLDEISQRTQGTQRSLRTLKTQTVNNLHKGNSSIYGDSNDISSVGVRSDLPVRSVRSDIKDPVPEGDKSRKSKRTKRTKKEESTRDLQYFEDPVCNNIKDCNPKDVLKYVKDNPTTKIPKLVKIFGPGVMKLKAEGLIQ